MLTWDTGQRVRDLVGLETTAPRPGSTGGTMRSGGQPRTVAAMLRSAACLLAVTSACTRITHEHVHSETGSVIQPRAGESVTAVLYSYKGVSPEEAQSIERKVGNCIADALESAAPDVRWLCEFQTAGGNLVTGRESFELTMLVVFLRNDVYEGYLWFSSADSLRRKFGWARSAHSAAAPGTTGSLP